MLVVALGRVLQAMAGRAAVPNQAPIKRDMRDGSCFLKGRRDNASMNMINRCNGGQPLATLGLLESTAGRGTRLASSRCVEGLVD